MTWDRSIAPRCNIGPDEVARRRRSAIALTALAALVAVALVALDAPPLARLLLFPFATGAAVNWAQVYHRFCVAFGALGIENFGRLGQSERVDAAQRAADRRRVVQLVLEGSAVGFALTLLLVIAPV
jgi:hypothetical protein